MALACDHPRANIDLPPRSPARLNWQPPAIIPGLPLDAQRVIREALQGIYDELTRLAATGTLVPLLDDVIYAKPGQTIQGVADGQEIILPIPIPGVNDPITVIVDDVKNPITVVAPDGTSTVITTPGPVTFHPGPTTWVGSPSTLLTEMPTDRLIGRDTAGDGPAEYLTVSGGIEFTGAGGIQVANDGVTNAKASNVPSPSLKGRTTASTGDPEDLTLVNSTSATWNTATGGSISVERAALTGVAVATANSNATTFGAGVDGAGLTLSGGSTVLDVVGSTSIVVTSDQVQRAALTGDVTASQNSNATTIANDAVTNAKLANMVVPRLKGRTSSGTGDPEDLVLLNTTSATWDVGTGGSIGVQRAALTGDVTASANSNATTIANNAITTVKINNNEVTLAKLAQIPTANVLGRTTTGTGNVEDLALSSSTSVTWDVSSGGSLSMQRAALTGDVTASANSNTTAIAAGVIVDADVNASAAIAQTKTGALTGEVTKASGSATTTIDKTITPTWTGKHIFSGMELITGLLQFTGVDTLNLNADTNALTSGTTVKRLNPNANRNVNGMVALAAGAIVILANVAATSSDFNIQFTAESVSATAANRFGFRDNCDLLPGECMVVWYDGTSSRWRQLVTIRT